MPAPTPEAVSPWPQRLLDLREQYRANKSLHATKTAYINGLEYEYDALRRATPEAVERVARAIYEANVTAQATWDHSVRVYPDAIETYRHLARAALAALRGD